MADDVNIFESSNWEREHGAVRATRIAAAAGSRDLGCALYELQPGGQAAPYHAHHGNEELLIVLDGTLELRTPAGRRKVSRGDVVAFPTGPEGAHRLRNASDRSARYLMVSTMRFPEIAEQLDTGTVLALKGPADGWSFPAGSARDYVTLTREAIEAEPGD